jgi:hypothetical protein
MLLSTKVQILARLLVQKYKYWHATGAKVQILARSSQQHGEAERFT